MEYLFWISHHRFCYKMMPQWQVGKQCYKEKISAGFGYARRACSKWHINELKLLTVKLSFQIFSKYQKMTSVHIQMDNILALTYLKNRKMTKIKNETWEHLISNGITITVEYLLSALNKLAHQESCYRVVQNGCWTKMSFKICFKLGTQK